MNQSRMITSLIVVAYMFECCGALHAACYVIDWETCMNCTEISVLPNPQLCLGLEGVQEEDCATVGCNGDDACNCTEIINVKDNMRAIPVEAPEFVQGKDDYQVFQQVVCADAITCEESCTFGVCNQSHMNLWTCASYQLIGQQCRRLVT